VATGFLLRLVHRRECLPCVCQLLKSKSCRRRRSACPATAAHSSFACVRLRETRSCAEWVSARTTSGAPQLHRSYSYVLRARLLRSGLMAVRILPLRDSLTGSISAVLGSHHLVCLDQRLMRSEVSAYVCPKAQVSALHFVTY